MEAKKSNSGLIVLIVVLVILILGLGGFIGYSLLNGNLTFDNNNNNSSNENNNNENNQQEEIEISNEEINTYLSYVPFSYTNMYDDDDMSNGLDAYSGKTTNLDNINKEILWENAFDKVTNGGLVDDTKEINIKVKNEICGKDEYDEYKSCTPSDIISKVDMDTELKTMYNIENQSINSFNVAGGRATFYDTFYAVFYAAGSSNQEKVSVLDKYEIENDNLIIYEKAGFILEDFGNYIVYKFREDYNKNVVKKFEGTIDESDTREKEAKDYIKDNINDFATFKHTFKLNKETNKYYWYQTEVV